MSNPNNDASNTPVAWFQDPNVPGNGPKPELEAYIHQGETEQTGSGPTGTAWVPTNPPAGEPAPATTGESKLDNLFPSAKPLAPVFHSKE